MSRRPVAVAVTTVLVPFLLGACGSGAPAAGPGSVGPTPTPTPTPTSASSVPGGPGIGPVPTSTPSANPPSGDFPMPDPAFAEHFADPLYHDAADELAPFGSDEGFDTLYTWAEERDELDSCTTLRSMYDSEDEGALARDLGTGGDVEPDVDVFVVSTGFTLLLLTGHIDPEGKGLVDDALRRQAATYDDASITQIPVMLRDLESFDASSCGS